MMSILARPSVLGAVLSLGIALAAPEAHAQSAGREVPDNRDQVMLSYAPVVEQAAPAVSRPQPGR